ncbi:hypothetical protein [Methanosarcina horonobensis]|uniref:hypothetical protein n=1 Tax=Methanosarcina horonobensis TaxID=418008 RepID=UPI000A4C3994|nr:hypothetical protein [Methanosarcina horonobensis]
MNKIKIESGATSVVVGPPTSQFPERILESGADIVTRFEYDFTIRDIADALENGKSLENVRGISFEKKGKEEEGGKIVRTPDRELLKSSELDSIPFVSKTYKKIPQLGRLLPGPYPCPHGADLYKPRLP